jgi:hypothetical protein
MEEKKENKPFAEQSAKNFPADESSAGKPLAELSAKPNVTNKSDSEAKCLEDQTDRPIDFSVTMNDEDERVKFIQNIGLGFGKEQLRPKLLGYGAVGTVYEVQDETSKIWALKVILRTPANQERIQRIIDVAQCVSELKRPTIVRIEKIYDDEPSGSSLFSVGDFKEPAKLIGRLRDANADKDSDPVSTLLQSKLSKEFQQRVREYRDGESLSQDRLASLVPEFNRLLAMPLYQQDIFVKRSEKTQRLLSSKDPKDFEGEKLLRLNRLLLEDTYPSEIAKSQQSRWVGIQMQRYNCSLEYYLTEVQKSDLTSEEQIEIAELCLLALGDVHSCLGVHRDVKPLNYLVLQTPFLIVIADLDSLHWGEDSLLTSTRTGTGSYLPPAFRGWKASSQRDKHGWQYDLHAFGLVCYGLRHLTLHKITLPSEQIRKQFIAGDWSAVEQDIFLPIYQRTLGDFDEVKPVQEVMAALQEVRYRLRWNLPSSPKVGWFARKSSQRRQDKLRKQAKIILELEQEQAQLTDTVTTLQQEKQRLDTDHAAKIQQLQQEKERVAAEAQQQLQNEKKRLTTEAQQHLQQEKKRLAAEAQQQLQTEKKRLATEAQQEKRLAAEAQQQLQQANEQLRQQSAAIPQPWLNLCILWHKGVIGIGTFMYLTPAGVWGNRQAVCDRAAAAVLSGAAMAAGALVFGLPALNAVILGAGIFTLSLHPKAKYYIACAVAAGIALAVYPAAMVTAWAFVCNLQAVALPVLAGQIAAGAALCAALFAGLGIFSQRALVRQLAGKKQPAPRMSVAIAGAIAVTASLCGVAGWGLAVCGLWTLVIIYLPKYGIGVPLIGLAGWMIVDPIGFLIYVYGAAQLLSFSRAADSLVSNIERIYKVIPIFSSSALLPLAYVLSPSKFPRVRNVLIAAGVSVSLVWSLKDIAFCAALFASPWTVMVSAAVLAGILYPVVRVYKEKRAHAAKAKKDSDAEIKEFIAKNGLLIKDVRIQFGALEGHVKDIHKKNDTTITLINQAGQKLDVEEVLCEENGVSMHCLKIGNSTYYVRDTTKPVNLAECTEF